jgi:hypothetical protein
MGFVDFIEAWWRSVWALVASSGVAARFQRSDEDRPNPSCSLNLRRNDVEVDLVVWESGEAELAIVEGKREVLEKHFEDIRNSEELGELLSRVVGIAAHKD